jgi:hypothetical protein
MKSVSGKGYPVRIGWSIGDGYGDPWNEICARVLEKFGLPGDKYTTEVSNQYMIFYFKEPEDALIAVLTLGDNGGYNPS